VLQMHMPSVEQLHSHGHGQGQGPGHHPPPAGKSEEGEEQHAPAEQEGTSPAAGAQASEGQKEANGAMEGPRTPQRGGKVVCADFAHGNGRPEPGSQDTPHERRTPTSPPPPTPHTHTPHPPPPRPTLAELLALLRETLDAVDLEQDLWELSGKAERLTREDVEMREIVRMAERGGAGWVGV